MFVYIYTLVVLKASSLSTESRISEEEQRELTVDLMGMAHPGIMFQTLHIFVQMQEPALTKK